MVVAPLGHFGKKVSDAVTGVLGQGSKSSLDAAGLSGAQNLEKVAALLGGKQQALAAVGFAMSLGNISAVDQLAQDARQALFGDPQDIEQIGHGHARTQIDEIDDTVVGPAEPLHFEQGIRIANEVPVGKEEQAHDIDGHLGKIVDG